MPSKIQLDENLWFLFICLQKSDYKTIDFNAVGQATKLKSPAARMRYTRLRRQIEGGTLIGTHGTPFSGVTEKISPEMRKRNINSQPETAEGEQPAVLAKTISPERKIKPEPEEIPERYDTDSSEGADSEDEMPLAKRRYDRVKNGNTPFEGPSAAITHSTFTTMSHRGQEDHPLVLNGRLDIIQNQSEFKKSL